MVAILDPTKVSSAMSSSEITNFKFNPIVNLVQKAMNVLIDKFKKHSCCTYVIKGIT